MDGALATATWWSYVQTDRAIVGAVVALVVIAAIAFLWWRYAGVLRARGRR